ncbi:S-layer homology domain-containing protein [Paenibacillus campi]|uniref:S-layer homology domain-containing protein n=1 Tax=Paenibacillus campi TaxID=3106031 RepID=UPI002AFE1171|nr:S-layer homology domain-containing protein [Paenibacillus sp. SGZ-1014]
MKYKWASLAAASVLTLSIGANAWAASQFGDIGKIEGKEKIESLQQRGFISGVTATQFKPEQTLNAAQGVQMLVKSFQLSLAQFQFIKAPQASDSYTKVKDGVWYSDAFIIATLNGIEVPRDIDPAAKLTREQFTDYLMAAMQKSGNLPMFKIDPLKIADDSNITAAYQGAIQRSLALHINKLDESGKFNPKQPITRADAAIMIYNALDYLQKHPELQNQAQSSGGMFEPNDTTGKSN